MKFVSLVLCLVHANGIRLHGPVGVTVLGGVCCSPGLPGSLPGALAGSGWHLVVLGAGLWW